MRKTFKVILLLTTISLVSFLISIMWDKYLSYYWHTKILTVYQNGETFRLCEGTDTLLPVWTPNEEYYMQIKLAEKAVREGFPITIVFRGSLSDTTKEVYVEEIHEVIVGVNSECE